MNIHEVKRAHPQKSKKTVGRGGKRGKTSGRGTKGQNARAGHKKRPEMRDIIKKLPKQRGYRFNSYAAPVRTVTLNQLSTLTAGATASPETLHAAGIIPKVGGKFPVVKILATGTLAHAVMVVGCTLSANAKTAIEKAGGTIK